MHTLLGSRYLLFLFGVFSAVAHVPAEIVIIPEEITLNRRDATHRIVVEEQRDGFWTADLTRNAKFESANPQIASVNEEGIIQAVSDGETIIKAIIDGKETETKVTVRGASAPFQWSFRNHVQPVLSKMGCNSGACHGAAAGKNGFKLSLRGYDHDWDHKVLTRQANGRRISVADPAESLMLLKPIMEIRHEGGERFEKDSEPYNIIREWIKSGAPGASESDPRVTHLEILPKDMMLANGAEQQMIVRAHFDNGAYEDVTKWVKFGTTDESVALVDDDGRVTIKGAGAASITAWYSSKVASARLLAPRDKPVAADIFAQAQRNNYIDELVLKQLASLQIAPAPEADDVTFIRRAYLDAIGTLPKPEEVYRFSMDPSSDKRAKLIDDLLVRPEYVDYWSYKWSDLFLLSSRNLTRREELSAFYRFIRESVEANQPWDEFCREILTAKGSTVENGAANYFVMHKETVDLTETTSQAFLGMSITCARCHNHPLEKWTQDDYYGMANLLSRVKLKNGKRGDDTDVQPADFGDIIHPRIGEPVPPQPLDAEPVPLDQPGDRREVLAQWMTSPENPYFTRAIVNRVWRNFMGRGLVEPEDDLRLTNPPSNAELMKALVDDLIENKYDLKHLMRTIMNSAAYQRSSKPADPEAPDMKYYSQYIIRRLPAEVILDAYSQVTGVPTKFDGYPEGYRALQLPDSQVGSYFLTAFGRPERKQTCSCERTEASSVAQTLHIANGDTLNMKLRSEDSFVRKLAEQAEDDERTLNERAIEDIFMRALSRFPNAEEKESALAVLSGLPAGGEGAAEARREALEDLTWAVLSGKEFLFNH